MSEYKNRKKTRLNVYDYNTPGAYFITICTKDREQILSTITKEDFPLAYEMTSQAVGTENAQRRRIAHCTACAVFPGGPSLRHKDISMSAEEASPITVGTDVPGGPSLSHKDISMSAEEASPITVGTENAQRRRIAHCTACAVFPGGPLLTLTDYGIVADKYIKQLDEFYDKISVEEYVIMPNHIHFLLVVSGPPRTSVPTDGGKSITQPQKTLISRFISTFKRFTNKEYGENIWQSRSYDHVVRNKQDYDEIVKYIYENPMRWYYDELYTENRLI